MAHYVPFLKMKQNEIGAICELHSSIRGNLTPFFDIPRPNDNTDADINERLRIAKKWADKELSSSEFYLDNFDLDDGIALDDRYQYETILGVFANHRVIAVAALNRDPRHNIAAIEFSKNTSRRIAIRFTPQDIESYVISKFELDQIYQSIKLNGIEIVDVVFDFRVIIERVEVLASSANTFLAQLSREHFASRVIVTGSSVPASVRDLLKTKEETIVLRKEWALWSLVRAQNSHFNGALIFGDYGIVSPDYTDMELNFSMILNVAAPKIFYTFDNGYYLIRGGSFKSHPAKYGQYFTMADSLVSKPFFRNENYSFGEQYIVERSTRAKTKASKGGSPGSWLKATLCSHMTFIFNSL